MNKLVSVFRKIARLLSIIILLVLAVLEAIALINELSNGGNFMGTVSSLTVHTLLMLLYAAPAILLLIKKDKEAKITFSFLLGYLFISAVLTLIGRGSLIDKDLPFLTVFYGIISFILGLAYGFVLICFLLSKVFGLKTMNLSYIVLIFSLALIFILFIIGIIRAVDQDWTFARFLNDFTSAIVVPSLMVFGLMLLEDNGEK